jgi:hypothetical protein
MLRQIGLHLTAAVVVVATGILTGGLKGPKETHAQTCQFTVCYHEGWCNWTANPWQCVWDDELGTCLNTEWCQGWEPPCGAPICIE